MAKELDNKPGSEYEDDWKPAAYSSNDQAAPDGDASDTRGEYNTQTTQMGDSADPHGDIKKAEESGGVDSGDNADRAKTDTVGKGWTDDSTGSKKKGLRGYITKRRAGAGVITGGLIGGTLFAFSILSGPAQFIQFAMLMDKFHLSGPADFGDDRGGKVLVYSLFGLGTERGRMFVAGNKAADKWEAKLLKETGLRPVYTKRTGRFIGFEIDNRNRFENFAAGFDDKDTAKLERLMGKGVEIRDARDLNTLQGVTRGRDQRVDPNSKIIDASNLKPREKRKLIRTIGNATSTRSMVSALGSRMLIKRSGVDFHPLKNVVRGQNDKAEFRKKVLKDWAAGVKSGVKARTLGSSERTNPDGTPEQSAGDKETTKEANAVIEKAREAELEDPESSKIVRNTLARGTTPAIAIGLLCSAKSFGSDVEQYKFDNNYMAMQRIGWNFTAMGNQIPVGIDTNMDETGVYSDMFYDEEVGMSWMNARSIQAELGQKQTGPDAPEEARLNNIGDKPEFFNKLDGIPLLGTACGALDAVGNLPIIKQVGTLASDAIMAIPGIEELKQKALAAAAGQSVNSVPQGPDLGNIGNIGMFLAGNDHSISMGGGAMSATASAALKSEQYALDKELRGTASIAQRYLDPYDAESLAGKATRNMPTSPSQMASIVANPLRSLGNIISGSFSWFSPAVGAQNAGEYGAYDYGVPRYGFTLEEQQDDRFENPFDNAKIIEEGNRLNELNDKYSECFGVKAVPEGNSVKLENIKAVNVFKIQKEHPECDPKKNKDLMFLRYRFYLADLVATKANACYLVDDEQACTELAGASEGSADVESTVSGEGGEKIAAVAEQEYAKNGNKPIESCGQNCGPEVQKYTGGPSGPGAPWCAWFVSWVYREAGYEFKGAPAGADGNIPAVINLIAWFKQHGIHYTPSSTQYKPQPGDVVMYGGDQHTGIVVKVSGDNIETVEGNTSGDGSFNAEGGTVGRKSYNYKTYNARSIEFGRLKSF